MNVKGMSIQDILDIDIDAIVRMKEKDLKQIASRLVSASNKRIRRLKSDKSGWGALSPSLNSITKQFSIAKKTRQQTLREFVNMKRFLTAKSSTFKGWKDIRKSMFKKVGGDVSVDEYKDFWKTYRRFEEMNKGGMIAVQYGIDQAQNGSAKGMQISERMLRFLREQFEHMSESGMSFEDMLSKMNEFIDNYYQYKNPFGNEKEEENDEDYEGFDIPF